MKKVLFLLIVISVFFSHSIAIASFSIVDPEKSFADVQEEDPHYESISYMGETGVFKGDDETGLFRPNSNINRAEFAVAIFRFSNYGEFNREGKVNCFPDVQEEWFANSVCWASSNFYISGYEGGEFNGYFKPDNNLSYAELVKILSRVHYWDIDSITPDEEWHEPSWRYAQKINILGADVTPHDEVLRSEMADILFKALIVRYFGLDAYYDDNWDSKLPKGLMEEDEGGFYRDINNVYFMKDTDARVNNADPDTYEIVYSRPNDLYFGKDKTYAFNRNVVIEGADPESFEHIAGAFVKDADHVFIRKTMLDQADINSFEYLGGMYAKDNDAVYSSKCFENCDDPSSYVLNEADVESFQFVDLEEQYGAGDYAMDKNYIYRDGVIFQEAE